MIALTIIGVVCLICFFAMLWVCHNAVDYKDEWDEERK